MTLGITLKSFLSVLSDAILNVILPSVANKTIMLIDAILSVIISYVVAPDAKNISSNIFEFPTKMWIFCQLFEQSFTLDEIQVGPPTHKT